MREALFGIFYCFGQLLQTFPLFIFKPLLIIQCWIVWSCLSKVVLKSLPSGMWGVLHTLQFLQDRCKISLLLWFVVLPICFVIKLEIISCQSTLMIIPHSAAYYLDMLAFCLSSPLIYHFYVIIIIHLEYNSWSDPFNKLDLTDFGTPV